MKIVKICLEISTELNRMIESLKTLFAIKALIFGANTYFFYIKAAHSFPKAIISSF
jgi:hypothetical protein